MTKQLICLWTVISFMLLGSMAGFSKSVYVIGDTDTSKILTYKVGDDELQLQKESVLSDWGLIDIAINESLEGTFLFLTYEGQSLIRVVDAKSMELIDDVELPHAADLSGIVYDAGRDRVYAVDRFSKRIYSYTWDSRQLSLEPDFDAPYYIELDNLNPYGGAVGITFDENNDLLYVSDATDTIKYYQANDWSYVGAIQTSIQEVLGIAVDSEAHKLYFGSMGDYGQQWKYLSSYDLTADPNYAEESEAVGASICGITCDPETGYVYATSFSDGSNGHEDSVLMFSPFDPNSPSVPNLTLVWDSPRTGSPAGIVFSEEDYKPSGIDIKKIDDVTGCVEPNDLVTYTIAIHSKEGEKTNVVVTDILPYEADFVSADPNTGTYYPSEHIYVWDVGTLADPNTIPGDPNTYLYLTVRVNDGAEPSGEMINQVIAESDTSYDRWEERTAICCWGGDVIYVNRDARFERIAFYGIIAASGYNNGTSWENAYRNLNDALERAGEGCSDEIWVAKATYYPGTDPTDDCFEVPDGVAVYGGFAGYETSREQRNWRHNETILSGGGINNTVVRMGDGSLLDGFTVTEGGYIGGVEASGGTSTIANSIIKDNSEEGIYCSNGNLTVSWCEIKDNGKQGIFHQASGYSLTVDNTKIHDNQWDGILTDFSSSTIINSLIYRNGSGGSYYGINLQYPPTGTSLRNNTVVHNVNEGIRFVGNSIPDVRNNILYYNNAEEPNSPQLAGINTTYYCCIYDPNGQSSSPDLNGNITCEPDFVYDSDPYGNYHIKYESYCRNGGDSSVIGQDETDMDGEVRIQEYVVDIGVDEVSCTETWNPKDWTQDGVVNYEEFAILSAAWLSHDPKDPVCDPNHPNYVSDPNDPGYISDQAKASWNPICNLDTSGGSAYAIDLADLAEFTGTTPDTDSWLWEACWHQAYSAQMSGGESMMMATLPLTSTLMVYESQSVSEKPISEQIYDLEDSVDFLEKLWLEDPYIQQEIDAQSWQKFMDAVYQSLDELNDTSNL